MLPQVDGLDVAVPSAARAMCLSLCSPRRVDETDRLIGLELGADDYVTKPFSPR